MEQSNVNVMVCSGLQSVNHQNKPQFIDSMLNMSIEACDGLVWAREAVCGV